MLYEISAPGGSSATTAQMEADTGLAPPLFNANGGIATAFFQYGRVLYEHGGGIDAPLGVVRMEYSDKLHDAQVILPHATWRGSYARGTTIGECFVYGTNGQFLLPPPDSTPSGGDGTRVVGGTYDGSAQHCINVDWPADYTWSARQYRRSYDGPVSWMGSLVYESRDASGLYYRRNRYYDSEKGRFTQEDPIGLAGGVNVYGFANGDPVTYGDPYGLKPDTIILPKILTPFMNDCASESRECKRVVDAAASKDQLWVIQLGKPGDCAPYIIGCTSHVPIPGHRPGGTIIIIPGEFGLVPWPVETGDVIGHELEHADGCGADENCARHGEQRIQTQRHHPVRPEPPATNQGH